MFCTKCGNALKENDKFCRKCGAPVKLRVQEVAPEPVVVPEPAEIAAPEPVVAPAPIPAPETAAATTAVTPGSMGTNKSVEDEAQAAMDYVEAMFAGLRMGRGEKSIPIQEAVKAFEIKKAATIASEATGESVDTSLPEEVPTSEAPTNTEEISVANPELEAETELAAAELIRNAGIGAASVDAEGDADSADADVDATDSAEVEESGEPKKTGGISRGTIFSILGLLGVIAAVLLWMWFFRPEANPNLYTEPGVKQETTPTEGAAHGTTGGNAPLPAASTSPLDLKDDPIMQASIKTYKDHGPNIGEIEEIYELKFTEDREYGLTGLSKAILFDDDLWYMNDIMENIHYTPELIRTTIEYFSCLQDRKNVGTDLALTYIRPDTDLYKEIESIEPDYKKHRIEKMQIGEIRRSGEDFYMMLNLFESAEGEETKESLKAVHIFARAKVMEMVEINEPTAKGATDADKPEEQKDEKSEEATDETGDNSEDKDSEDNSEDKDEEEKSEDKDD